MDYDIQPAPNIITRRVTAYDANRSVPWMWQYAGHVKCDDGRVEWVIEKGEALTQQLAIAFARNAARRRARWRMTLSGRLVLRVLPNTEVRQSPTENK